MKKRAASSLLAILAVVSLILPALAAASADPPAVEEPFPEVSQEIEEVQNAICLDGEPVFTVEYEIRDGVCYATVNSFVSMMDAEAMVEEEDGVVRVNASAVVEVVEIPAQGESMSEEFQKTVEAAQMQAAEDGLWMAPDETQQPVDGMGEEDAGQYRKIRLFLLRPHHRAVQRGYLEAEITVCIRRSAPRQRDALFPYALHNGTDSPAVDAYSLRFCSCMNWTFCRISSF